MSVLEIIEKLENNTPCTCPSSECRKGYSCAYRNSLTNHLNRFFKNYNEVMKYEIRDSNKRYNNNFTEEDLNNYKFNFILRQVYNRDSLIKYFDEFERLFELWISDIDNYDIRGNLRFCFDRFREVCNK